MSLPRYPVYKPSRVEWLGEVPAHWEMKRLKFVANRSEVKVGVDEDNPLPYIGLEHVESWSGRLFPLDEELTPTGVSNFFKSGDTLFGKLRPYLAKACNVDFEGLCSSELLVLRGRNYERRFLLYQLLNPDFINIIDSSTYGSKMPRASWDFIGSCELAWPSLEEQQAIADFLDAKTAQIDALMEKKRQLIARLKEKRSALIARTVTRGLPPDAAQAAWLGPHPAMKDSGIEWLGDILAHWEVKRLGFISSKIGSGKTPLGGAETYIDDGVLFVRSQNVYDEGLLLDDVVYLSEEIDADMQTSRLKPLDILLNITGASIGRSCIVPEGFAVGNVNQHVCVIRLRNLKQSYFVSWVMKSSLIKTQIDAAQSGAAREGLNFDQVAKLVFALPPLEEQQAIAAYLDRETARLDQLAAKIETALARLVEYRHALITAAVTGKIDMRDVGGEQGNEK